MARVGNRLRRAPVQQPVHRRPRAMSGNNTDLLPQTNVGYDVGFDWTPSSKLSFSLTGFYEFFQNELVSQAGSRASRQQVVHLQRARLRAPGHRTGRGLEAHRQAGVSRPHICSTTSIYTDYTERLYDYTIGQQNPDTSFDRAGNKIPGVAPNEVSIRLAYDQADGPLKGWGAFAEYQWRDAFYADNGNILSIPEADYVNLNVHYAFDTGSSFIKSGLVYFEVRNVFDNTYISGANNISDKVSGVGVQNPASVLANSTGSIYAGSPQAFIGGVKFKY